MKIIKIKEKSTGSLFEALLCDRSVGREDLLEWSGAKDVSFERTKEIQIDKDFLHPYFHKKDGPFETILHFETYKVSASIDQYFVKGGYRLYTTDSQRLVDFFDLVEG